jgi:hypothetical protein
MTLKSAVFLTGVEKPNGDLLMGTQNGDFDILATPHTIIKSGTKEGSWSDLGQLSWTSACASKNVGNDGVVFLGPYGRWLEMSEAGPTKGNIIPDVDEEDPDTTFRFLKPIAGSLYAGGTDRHIYRQTEHGWSAVHSDRMISHPVVGSAENLTGFGEDELYAMGWDGDLWTNVSGEWQPIDSPTNVILNDGDVLDDTVYIGGQIGIILKGRGDDWTVIENDVLKQDIWSVCAYGDAVYFSCMSGIMRLRGDDLELIKTLGPDMRTAMSLFVGPSGLYSVGASDIVLFDGNEWHTIAQSD